MDKIFSEPNEENDCTERVRKKRLSSILKVPRSPLQDLGSGNEFTQDYHAEKRRKSSRRVSFADTINFRVFKTDVKVNMTEPGNVETARDVRNQVLLNQNEGSETAQCEITGMDTLLHAPIQTSVQQTECNADHTSEEMNRHDRTLIFSDENEMDMTASCTAVIMRSNLKRNQETDQPRKIDFTSFMAELASRSEEMAKKFNFFSDPTNDACSSLQQKPDDTTVKKINFNEFLMSVKSSKEVASPTSAVPDKKNLFFVSPQVLEGSIFSPMEDAYNHAQENTCDVTKIFRGQDDGMDVTKCHSSDMKTFFPATCEASSKQLGHEDITVSFRNDGMDMTASHTVKLSFSKNGPSNTENQNQNSSMDFSSNFVSGNSRLEGPPNNQFGVQKGPQTCVGTKTVNDKDEVDFTRSHTICVDKHEVTQISKQGAREMVMMPGSISSGSVFLDNKTVFSTCKDVDVTGNRTDVICKETSRETCDCYEASQKMGNAIPLLMENTISGHDDDMDITKRHITLDNQVLGQCKIREPIISSVLESRSKRVIQNHRTAALNVGVNSHANSSFWLSKCGFQDNLANSHIVSEEEMDLTKSYIANGIEKSTGNEFPSDISTSMTNKPQSFDDIPTACNLNEQEEMEIIKSHAVVTGNQTTRVTAGLEQMQPKIITCESWKKNISEAVSPLDSNKENLLLVKGNNTNVEIIHTLDANVGDLKEQVDFERAGEKNAYVGGLHSIPKNIFSLQEPDKEVPQRQTIATNRRAQTNFQKQTSEISQPLNKSLFDHSLAFANDERGIFSDDQDMDITRNHTVALAFATSGRQKCENTHSQNTALSKPQQLQNNTLLFSGDFNIDITRSQTAAIDCGNFKMSSKQEHLTTGSDQIPDSVAPSVSFISSNETVPCGIKGYVQYGKTAGIYLSDKESELQGQSHTVEPLSEGMPDIANSAKLLSTSKGISSKEDVSKSRIAANNDMYLRCAEESSLARTSRPYSKNPQLSPCPEKSVVFSSKENMDPTGSYSLNVQAKSPDKVLKEEKVVAKYGIQVEDNILFPKEKDVITTNSLRQQGYTSCPMISGKNTLNLTDLKPMSLLNEKTVLFSEDNDMEITRKHTGAADNKMYAQKKSSSRALLCFPADKTRVFTCSDDMEITTLNTVVIDKPVEMASSQVVPKSDKGPGRKSQIGSTGEKTTLFSFGVKNDMEITESCTAAIDRQISSKGQKTPCEPTLRHADKTHVSTCSDDMEITALNTVVIDKPIEKAASQVVPKVGKGAGRRSQIRSTGDETTLFSFGVEREMEITESCTAAIVRQISSKGQKTPCKPTLCHVDKTHVSTCNDDMEITALNSVVIDKPIEKAASQVVPKVGKGAGRRSQIGSTGDETALFSCGVEHDMEITASCTAAIDRQMSSKRQEPPLLHMDKNIEFAFNRDDMQITESRAVPRIVQRVMFKDQLKLDAQVGQEALSNNKTAIFPMGENMEIIKIPKVAVDYNEIALRGGQPNQTVALVDKTIVFTGNQDNMEITASHTTAVNNTLKGYENQEVSDESSQQQSLYRKPSSACREKIYSKHTEDFRSDCQLELKDKYGTNFPVSSETNIIKIHNGATDEFVHSEDALDIIQKPQNFTDFPKANSTVYSEDLVKLVKPKDTKSFKLLENQLETSEVKSENEVAKNSPVACSEENGDAVLHVQSPIQQSHLHKDISECLKKNAHSVPNTGKIDLKNDSGKLTSSRQECRLTDLVTDGADAVTISYKDMEENEKMPFERKTLPKDFQTTSEQTEQLSLVTAVPIDQIDPNCVPALSGIVNVCSRLKHIRRNSEFATISEIDPVSNFEQLPKLATQPGDSFRVGTNTENKSNNAVRIQEPADVYFESAGASVDTVLDTVHKGACQGRKIRLGIFPPKLPNNRNCNTSNAQDLNTKAEEKEKTAVPEVNLVTRETPENTYFKHNLSPSQFIAEELLPVFPEEMDSNDSLNCDPPDGALSVMDNKEIFPNKRNSHEEQEMCSNQKRAIEQEEKELQNGKKLKRDDGWDGNAPNQQQPTCNTSHTQAETPECEEPPNLSTKSPDRTHSSNSSSLDSIKADADFSSTQPNSQMESQLLTDSICEQNLLEKFQDGVITVREFFTLLQVHIVIQKPRQSHLPANFSINATSAPEDQFFNQYIYRPKLQIYEEDCQLLSQMVNELKLRASDQDKLLVDVNRNLWEVMRTCSDEELKNFGAELNKMKSYFTKKSKVLAHNGKVQLYGKLLQDIQVQWENLHSRMAKVDEFLKEVDNCRLALEASTNLEDYGTENDDQLSEWESRIRNAENELVDLKVQDEVLQRDLSNLEAEKQQVLAEIKHLKKKANDCQELLERYNFTEWEISEWSDHQAVFTFLYDSIELTLKFGPPIDGVLFNEKPCKKTVDVSFESLLDEEKAPLSSRLVKRLIFQFIESQKSWQEKCPTLNHVPQMLHEVSLVVCRCRLLGEEIEFLMKWGGKFNLLKTEVDDTKVKLLFSTSTAFAKFEVTLSLSATYPSAPLPFTVQKLIGNLSQDEISAVVSSVPLGTNYLRRMVKLIHHKLFP
ncbi:kinetochore scaffold 1 isoform X2 [Alligator mississippiensis]|uniref:kinetochore scaffold 1 isoform X2 n=1 Tax=Alligator mississippiensis TaxID=8496 RepID=UPI0009071DF6|nr:kinetochore scaffold 1 isoform X2 [Alligator mississippiensis]